MLDQGDQNSSGLQAFGGINPILHERVQVMIARAGPQIIMGTGIRHGKKFGYNSIAQQWLLTGFADW
jgi:hypothetical protein